MLRSQCFQLVELCWVFSFSFINSTAKRYRLNLPKQIVPSDLYGHHTEILEENGVKNILSWAYQVATTSQQNMRWLKIIYYKQKAMDATPPSTSIIILYSGAGYTFGNEIRILFLRRWVVIWVTWNWNEWPWGWFVEYSRRMLHRASCTCCVPAKKPNEDSWKHHLWLNG